MESQGVGAKAKKVMDDMSGFYTSLDRSGVLQRAKYAIDKFKKRFRKPKHWLLVANRGYGAVKFGKSSS